MKLNCIICDQKMSSIKFMPMKIKQLICQIICQKTQFSSENYHYLQCNYDQNEALLDVLLSYRISADQVIYLDFDLPNQITKLSISKNGSENPLFKFNYLLKTDFLKSAEEFKKLKSLVLRYVNLSTFS